VRNVIKGTAPNISLGQGRQKQSKKIQVSWDVMPSRLANNYRRLERLQRLQLQGRAVHEKCRRSVTPQKTQSFNHDAERTRIIGN
jgi:hypothetical protein